MSASVFELARRLLRKTVGRVFSPTSRYTAEVVADPRGAGLFPMTAWVFESRMCVSKYLMRADSATIASVWLRKTTTRISDSDAASAASGADHPVGGHPAPDDRRDGPGPRQQRGDGDQPLRRQRHGQHRHHDGHGGRSLGVGA